MAVERTFDRILPNNIDTSFRTVPRWQTAIAVLVDERHFIHDFHPAGEDLLSFEDALATLKEDEYGKIGPLCFKMPEDTTSFILRWKACLKNSMLSPNLWPLITPMEKQTGILFELLPDRSGLQMIFRDGPEGAADALRGRFGTEFLGPGDWVTMSGQTARCFEEQFYEPVIGVNSSNVLTPEMLTVLTSPGLNELYRDPEPLPKAGQAAETAGA